MKVFLSCVLLLSSLQASAFELEGSWQLDHWTCASGQAVKREFDHLQDKALFNFRYNGTYDFVFISAGDWGVERGVFQQQNNRVCFEVREGLIRERPFWFGSQFRGCSNIEQFATDRFQVRTRETVQDRTAVCDAGEVLVIHYKKAVAQPINLFF